MSLPAGSIELERSKHNTILDCYDSAFPLPVILRQ